MSTIKHFCRENNLLTVADRTLVAEACETILGFMHEFGFPYSEDDFNSIKELHQGTSVEIDWWQQTCSRKMWLSSLQSIKSFPTYSVFTEYKSLIEEAIVKWIKNR